MEVITSENQTNEPIIDESGKPTHFSSLKKESTIYSDCSREEFKVSFSELAEMLGVSNQAISSMIQRLELPVVQVGKNNYLEPAHVRKLIQYRLKHNYKCITFSTAMAKGGIGKTTITTQVACYAARNLGYKVLIIDADPQGNSSLFCRYPDPGMENLTLRDIFEKEIPVEDTIKKVTSNLHIIPSNLRNSTLDFYISLAQLPIKDVFKRLVIDQVRGDYDLIIVDCAPALNTLNSCICYGTDFNLNIVTPEEYCISGLNLTKEYFEQMARKYGSLIEQRCVFNKYSPTLKSSRDFVYKHLAPDAPFRKEFFDTCFRHGTHFEKSVGEKISVFEFKGKKAPVCEDIENFCSELLDITLSTTQSEAIQ